MAANTTLPHRQIFTATIGAAIVNILVYLIAKAAGVSMGLAASAPMPAVPFPMVITSSLIPTTIAAYIIHLIMAKNLKLGKTLAIVFVALAAISAVSPFAMAADAGTGITLAIMHLVAAAAIFLATRSK